MNIGIPEDEMGGIRFLQEQHNESVSRFRYEALTYRSQLTFDTHLSKESRQSEHTGGVARDATLVYGRRDERTHSGQGAKRQHR